MYLAPPVEGEVMAMSLEKGPNNAFITHSMNLLLSLHSKEPGLSIKVTDRVEKVFCGLVDLDLKLMLITKDFKYHHRSE